MSVQLLLQEDVFSEDELADTKSIISKYFDVVPIKDEKLYFEDIHWPGPFRGSLYLANKLRRDLHLFDVMAWLPELKEFSVHKDYYFLDLLEIQKRNTQWPIFIRPCSGVKTFSGDVFTKEKLDTEINFLNRGKNIQNCICLVSKPSQIEREWRCVFVGGKYCSGSQYMLQGEKALGIGVPDSVVQFAQQIAQHPFFLNQFEYVIDIGENPKELKLIEINAFPTASFYLSDLDKIYSTYKQQFS